MSPPPSEVLTLAQHCWWTQLCLGPLATSCPAVLPAPKGRCLVGKEAFLRPLSGVGLFVLVQAQHTQW